MNILCTDKTGTLTEGKVKLQGAQDVHGKASDKGLFYWVPW
jgi:Mg2+-importing ATPase